MTAHLSRRTLLGAVPTLAAPMALLPASIVDAAADTPILRMFRDHEAMTACMDDRAISEAEFNRLYAEQTVLEWRMTREPVTCAADVAAKILALTGLRDDQGAIFEPALLAECEALVTQELGQ